MDPTTIYHLIMRTHTATFLYTEGDWLKAEIEVDGFRLLVMDEFGGEILKSGQQVEIELAAESNDDDTWDGIFKRNPDKKKCLQHLSGWSYAAFGKIISVSPVVCDCGIVEIEGAIDTHDERCIGEYIGFTVSRLTACLA